jgi:succinyl-diaminopimelate desuccinylase
MSRDLSKLTSFSLFDKSSNCERRECERSITELVQILVRIPTRAAVDSYEPIFAVLSEWLAARGVSFQLLRDQNHQGVALVGTVGAKSKKPVYLVNATVDTVGFGNLDSWAKDPLGAIIEDGWLHGRGSADSKAGVAIFCHVLAAFQARHQDFPKALGFVFDSDEHTGRFAGIRAFLSCWNTPIAGVMIGYPGLRSIGVGARGFWRATIRVHGRAGHSGLALGRGLNATTRAARLVNAIDGLHDELCLLRDKRFSKPPRITVTGVRGGGEFSMIPDVCEVDVDVRLTPTFTNEDAKQRLELLLNQIDSDIDPSRKTQIVVHDFWPAYRLPENSELVAALSDASEEVLGKRPLAQVTGPSNIGNFLSQHGIAATCGLGPRFRNAHAANESIELASIGPVFQIYESAIERLLMRYE